VGLLDLELYDDGTAAVAVIVSPDHRRRGLATVILQSLFDLPQTQGLDRIGASQPTSRRIASHTMEELAEVLSPPPPSRKASRSETV